MIEYLEMPTKRKIFLGTLSLLLLVVMTRAEGLHVFALIEHAHAAAAALDPVFKTIDQALSWVAIVAHFFVYVLTAICGLLLDPTFINLRTDTQSMGTTLLKLWQISRNITNIILAFMLIIGAIMTVVFAEGGYVQKYAVKFVLAVILVNFSWFFPRVILDLSNVLTATVYSLPSAINVPCKTYDKKNNQVNCKVIVDFAFFEKKNNLDTTVWKCPMDFDGAESPICVKEADLASDANTPNAIFGGLIYNHARFQYFTEVQTANGNSPVAGPSTTSRLPQLLIFTLLMSIMVFFSLALLFPLLALVLVLLIRIPIIWITVAFMPFMFIGFVAGDTAALKVFNPMEIWNKFLHAAFIPVVTAIPFSVGFIMVNVGLANQPAGWNLTTHPFMKVMKVTMLPGVNNLWQILWVAMSIAVVWMGAQAAFKMDTLFEKFASPIMNAGASMGRLFMKLPLLVPLPLPGVAGGVKPTGLQLLNVLGAPDRALISGGKFVPPNFGPVGGVAAVGKNDAIAAMDQRLRADNTIANQRLTEIKNALDRLKTANTEPDKIAATVAIRSAINETLKPAGKSFTNPAAEMKDIINNLHASLPPALQAKFRKMDDTEAAKLKDS